MFNVVEVSLKIRTFPYQEEKMKEREIILFLLVMLTWTTLHGANNQKNVTGIFLFF